jgi:hypothetical protein
LRCSTAPGVQADLQVAVGVDLFNGPELAIGDVLVFVRCGELDAVSGGKFPLGFALDVHALQAARIVGDLLAVAALDCE